MIMRRFVQEALTRVGSFDADAMLGTSGSLERAETVLQLCTCGNPGSGPGTSLFTHQAR